MSASKQYDKLVRDRIPEIIMENGDTCVTHVATDSEYREKLIAKLDEEVAEFKEAHDPDELADILEVIESLATMLGMEKERLYGLKAAKARARGGFAKRIILERTN